jgi:hypothetical protein
MKIFLALLLTVIGGNSALAAVYYVSTTGSDSNAGTANAPFLTIQKGVDIAKAGDTIIVSDGTYGPNGHYTCGDICSQNGYAAPVVFYNSGSTAAPITIKAQNKWGAVLDCQLPYGYAGNGTDGVKACDTYFDFQGSASYITVQDFQITRSYWSGANVNGANNHNIKFLGNHFHDIGNRHYVVTGESFGIVGVYAGTPTSYLTFDGNVFNNIGRLPTSGQSTNDYNHDHGLYIYNGPYTIQNNVFYNNTAGWGVQFSPGTHDTTVQENTFSGANPQRDGQIILWGTNTNVKIQNNIFYRPRNYAVDTYQSGETNTLIGSNIICCGTVGVIASIPSGTTVSNNSTGTDPLFVNSGTFDFHLQSGSPAIDRGATLSSIASDFDGTTRPQGNAYDAGAFEFVGAGNPTPTTFSVAAAPTSVTLTKKQNVTIVVAATLTSGSVKSATFAVSNLPSGISAIWTPGSCAITCSSNLKLTASPHPAVGSWPLTVTGTVIGSPAQTVTITLKVQ